MEIRAIRTEADYLAALREVSALIDLDPAAWPMMLARTFFQGAPCQPPSPSPTTVPLRA